MANHRDIERILRGEVTPLEVAIERINRCVKNGKVKLDLSSLDLTSLPPLPEGIRILNCNQNQLTALPSLPESIERLYCENNRLETLPSLPSTLKILNCDTNLLTSLPTLPLTLKNLLCNQNQLTALPSLPPTLEELYCSANSLTSLPSLPPTLNKLGCNENQLTTLPPLPPRLNILYCESNSFIKPFQDLIDPYIRRQINLSTLIPRINSLHAEIASLQSQGKSVQAVNLLTRQQWDPSKTTMNMGNVLQGNVGSLISSMLTGKEGSTAQQMTLLRGNAAQLGLPGTALTNIAKANALKKIQNQRKKGGSRKKSRKTKKTRKH